MEHSPNIESGLQFLNRIKVRPTLQDIEKKLFPNGLLSSETVELCGNLSSGKTLLLTQLIAKCILPNSYDGKSIGGLGVSVILINTDHHFMILKLRDLLMKMLVKNKNTGINQLIMENIIKQSMQNLIIINCYSNFQYSLTIKILNETLLKNDKIGLVAIDSIAAYYWSDRQIGGEWLMTRYIEDILKIIQKHTFISKVPLIYTKSIADEPSASGNSAFLCVDKPTLGKINYRIKLMRLDDGNKLTCNVESSARNIELDYSISIGGIVWSNSTKCKTNPSKV